MVAYYTVFEYCHIVYALEYRRYLQTYIATTHNRSNRFVILSENCKILFECLINCK